ncbi:M42 family metallopeptidase [Aquibium microcysteis]|uniref:M42 family metallopeptidase n=1 Tax=Aquibium microcysteis TaxID=675281 RepID=UPI001EF16BF9|nr:M20/M25/M40 family metallo-hydrolase [Aquibium microcysteis]
MDVAALTAELMTIPGLCGHEGRVRARIRRELDAIGLAHATDVLGNLTTTLPGDPEAPSVMLIAHMDQLGFMVRRIEKDGFLRLERVGGVPERALAAQPMLICVGEGRDVTGIVANKAHHATTPDEKYAVVPYPEIYLDAGFRSADEVEAAGIRIGTPVVYAPAVRRLANGLLAGTSVDDRAGCAVMLAVARALATGEGRRPTVHLAFSVQEEFNLRGVLPAVHALKPAIAIQIDLVLATDTPDMAARGDVRLGGGPAMGLYSFHGRGTLNGLIPHPALTGLFERTAAAAGLPLQRSVHIGALTETSYVQIAGTGVACLDVGFPMRASHSANEVVDPADLDALARLIVAALHGIGPGFPLDPDATG